MFQVPSDRTSRLSSLKQKLRLNIKSNHVNGVSGPLSELKPSPETQTSLGARRRRKTSQDLKYFDYMSVFSDKTVSAKFQDFYALGQKLGEGAESVVYSCTQKATSKKYAVKICKKRDLEPFENMRNNYQILKQLDHQSIIRAEYLYLDEKNLTCHLVMEYCEQPDLSHYIHQSRKIGPLSEGVVANIMYGLLECLAYLHKKGVCHRDIKPENILYDESNGSIKLIDFDLCRMSRYDHQKLELLSNCGTLNYRAPESFKGGYGLPVDTWASGTIMFELLTGRTPFRSPTYGGTVSLICSQEIKYDNYQLSHSAVSLLSKLLQRDPELRIHPKEALSSPFILKNMNKRNLLKNQHRHFLKHCHTLDLEPQILSETSDQEKSQSPHRFYDESVKFGLRESIGKDIGVRRVDENSEQPQQ